MYLTTTCMYLFYFKECFFHLCSYYLNKHKRLVFYTSHYRTYRYS